MEAAAQGHPGPDREGTEGPGGGAGGGPDGGDPGQRLTEAVGQAYTAAVEASERLAAAHDVNVEQVAREAVTAALDVLGRLGCITAPTQAPEPMTEAEAAMLLCRTSGTVKLNEPDVDHVQLLESYAMVEYAWAQTLARALPAAELVPATRARALLMRHHHQL